MWACGFGSEPDIVKNRLISIGSHSQSEAEKRRVGWGTASVFSRSRLTEQYMISKYDLNADISSLYNAVISDYSLKIKIFGLNLIKEKKLQKKPYNI